MLASQPDDSNGSKTEEIDLTTSASKYATIDPVASNAGSQEVEELQNGENNQVVFAQYSRESAVVTHSSDYWTKRDNAKSRNRIEKMKSRTRESIVQNTMRLMTTTASDIVGPSEELDDTINICKKAEFGLGELNIIDLTDNTNALCEPHADQRDLCQILRTPVIKPEDYLSAKHYDLRAVENIAGTWIDLMCSPSNGIVTERDERTSAMDGVILVIKNLFRPFNDIVHTRWWVLKLDI
ncbi:hypothetical protein G6F35_011724 [Rhizopus arrhizus]|nr:hypothetical protein G6F35_011724 [Rhizopus arrhizus]